MILFDLFTTFILLGAFSFGGGIGSMELIRNRVVSVRGWMTNAEFTDIISIFRRRCNPSELIKRIKAPIEISAPVPPCRRIQIKCTCQFRIGDGIKMILNVVIQKSKVILPFPDPYRLITSIGFPHKIAVIRYHHGDIVNADIAHFAHGSEFRFKRTITKKPFHE